MATLAQLRTQRTTSGARYLAAIAELRSAYVELASLDMAINNRGIGDRTVGEGTGATPEGQGFAGVEGQLIDAIPVELRHKVYAPGAGSGIRAAVIAAFDAIRSAFT